MQPIKYEKLPSVVEAMPWDGTEESAGAVINWVLANGGHAFLRRVSPRGENDPEFIMGIVTLEGTMRARPGWHIIKGVAGEFYACEPVIFAQLHRRLP